MDFKYIPSILFIMAALVLHSCSHNDGVSGGSSQTDNAKVQVSVVYPDGTPARGASLFVNKSSFINSSSAAAPLSTTLDSMGIAIIDQLEPGAYILTIQDSLFRGAITKCLITDSAETMVTLFDTLQTAGALTGSVESDGAEGLLYIQGTPFVYPVDTNGVFSITNLPPYHDYTLIYHNEKTPSTPLILDSISVISDSVVSITFPQQWLHLGTLSINTTLAGANTLDTIYQFPLSLALDKLGFPFAQTNNDGSDIRFFDESGNRLMFDIEHYDRATESGLLWVEIPRIIPNNTQHSITMVWGNPNAVIDNESSPVFTSDKGYVGVWHFNTSFVDAVDKTTTGTAHGTASIIAESYRGSGLHLAGNDSYLEFQSTPRYSFTGDFTLSAWVKTDSLSKYSWDDAIISKGDNAYLLGRASGKDAFALSAKTEYDTGVVRADGFTQLNDLNWHHLAGVRSGDSLFMYTDGNREGAAYLPGTLLTTTNTLIIGARITSDTLVDNFTGTIDEVQVSSITRSASWITLSYLTQKTDQQIVTFTVSY